MIRESGGDRSAVTGGTQVLSDWIRVRITATPGFDLLTGLIGWSKAPSGKKRRTKSRLIFC